jgi:hypothetical protein
VIQRLSFKSLRHFATIEFYKTDEFLSHLQELLIQQLQDELARVRRQLVKQHDDKRAADSSSSAVSDGPLITGDADELRIELNKAIKQIARLSQEKQTLIDLGNRLRAQLIQNGR